MQLFTVEVDLEAPDLRAEFSSLPSIYLTR